MKDADRTPKRGRLPATVIALGITSLFTDVGSEMIFPLLPVFVASLGASPTFLGLVEGLADAVASLLKLGSGYIADRAPAKKPLVLFGYGIAALVRPLVALATAPWHVLAVRVTDRIGKGIRSTPRDVLIANSVPAAETGRAFGFHQAMDHTGAVLGPLIATGLLWLGLPLRGVFAVALVPGVLSVLAAASVREGVVAQEPTKPAQPTDAPHAPPVAPVALSSRLRAYLVILTLFSLGNSSDAFLLLRARELGIAVSSLPLLWTLFHIVKLGSAYVGGGWSDRVPRARLIVLGWLVYAVTYVGFGLATDAWHAWTLLVIYGLYEGLTQPAEKALVKDLAPPEARGRAYGVYSFVIGMSALPAGLLTGWLWHRWSALVALSVGGALAATGSIALLIWEATAPRNASQGGLVGE